MYTGNYEYSLFRNEKFVLEMFQQNASKFVTFYLIPMNYFSFFISNNFTFSLINALVYVDIDQDIHKGKSKVA